MIRFILKHWLKDDQGNTTVEAAYLLPMLLILMVGCYDVGMGIMFNQKTVAASQMIGDLIARDRSVTMSSLEDIIAAGRLAYEPYDSPSFGYDIASIQFDSDGDPVVLWRVTENMAGNDGAVDSAKGLGAPGEGVVVVTTKFDYDPYFTRSFLDTFEMQEVAFLRGRRSATVACNDCPS